ncbi:MAG: hypothetical protein QOH73_248, partial [Gaiellaceae bacterium]|nr:hypothetical protein [Gaiellaceae bacterium]
MRAHSTDPSSCSPLNRLRRRLAAEQGMSLILTLGFLVIFTISTAAIVNELVLNESGAKRDQTMITALGAAEAELNFAQQWVAATDAHDSMAANSIYPATTADSPTATLAASDTTPDSTLYFTGNAVSGATGYGWWARKYDPTTCGQLQALATPSDNTFTCWLVNGRATIGQSTREVQVLLNGNSNETTSDVVVDPSTTTVTVTGTGTATNTSTVTVPV